jgi:alpha-L-fucosidase
MLFIDGEGKEITKETCWALQPDCLVTRGAIETPEQHVPGRPPEGAWESNLTMGTQWQYKPTHEEYKSGTRIIEILIETRAKGGALMMNVGPKPSGELPIEQEERLREVALWHAVNGEAVHGTRPWVVAREENIWFTRRGDTVYALLTGVADWERGTRKTFILQSVEATPRTGISVLGHAGVLSEYQPERDVTPRFQQTEGGLELSVCRAQRLYNNHAWPNPVVVKLEHVKAAFEAPPYAETLPASEDEHGNVVFEGELLELAGADEVEVGFEYQVYRGFAAAMHNTDWTRTALRPMRGQGPFRQAAPGLTSGATYQYRAVVRHPRITMRGDHLRISVP